MTAALAKYARKSALSRDVGRGSDDRAKHCDDETLTRRKRGSL